MREFLRRNRGIILIVLGVFGFRTAIADWNPVPSSSMEPTIYPGDVVWVNKTLLGPALPFTSGRLWARSEPHRGDIITFQAPHVDEVYIKRVIGVPGDRIATDGIHVLVNGKALKLTVIDDGKESGILRAVEFIDDRAHYLQVNQRYVVDQLRQEVVVPEHAYFVMGDYRNNSEDSRVFGFVPEANILGRATRLAVSVAEERNPFTSVGQLME
jgi:signal peptidase I